MVQASMRRSSCEVDARSAADKTMRLAGFAPRYDIVAAYVDPLVHNRSSIKSTNFPQ